MEIFDLYDKNRSPLGETSERGKPVPKGKYRLVVHVCIINSENKMLIQQRQPFITSWSGLWDITCGGSAVSGETSSIAAERELSEELGINISFADLRPSLTINFDEGFDDIYIVKKDIGISSLKFQYEEVKTAKWASADEIISMIKSGEFIPYHEELIKLIFFMKDKMGTHTREDK